MASYTLVSSPGPLPPSILIESRSVVFEALPIVFITRRQFSAEQFGLMYIGMLRASAGCLNLTPFRSCLCWRSPGWCNLRLALKKYKHFGGEMGGLPTSRSTAYRCYDRWSAPGDRLLLARLDWRVQSYPLVCSDALDRCNRLCGQLDIRFVPGGLFVLVRETGTHSVHRAT